MLFKILLVFKRYQPNVWRCVSGGFCCEIFPYPKLGHPAALLQASVIGRMYPSLIRIARASFSCLQTKDCQFPPDLEVHSPPGFEEGLQIGTIRSPGPSRNASSLLSAQLFQPFFVFNLGELPSSTASVMWGGKGRSPCNFWSRDPLTLMSEVSPKPQLPFSR